MGSLGLPGGEQMLVDFLRTPDLHRDVKYAVVGVLKLRIEDEAIGPVLLESAMRDSVVASSLLRTAPQELTEDGRKALGVIVTSLLDASEMDLRQKARLAYAMIAPWAGQGNEILIRQLSDYHRHDWLHVGATLASAAEQGVFAGLEECCSSLMNDVTVPTEESDLPALRRLQHLIETWATKVYPQPQSIGLLRRIAQTLSTKEETVYVCVSSLVKLCFSANPPHIQTEVFEELADVVSTHSWITPWVESLTPQLIQRTSHEELLSLAQRYCQHESAGLVLPLVKHGGEVGGWTPSWSHVIQALREHADPRIRMEARSVNLTP